MKRVRKREVVAKVSSVEGGEQRVVRRGRMEQSSIGMNTYRSSRNIKELVILSIDPIEWFQRNRGLWRREEENE
jgi:hypothetical protein